MKYIKKFQEISILDTPSVGGKNSSLGQMFSKLAAQQITVPDGFAVTADAYWYYVQSNNLMPAMQKYLAELQKSFDMSTLQQVGRDIRSLFLGGKIPDDLAQEILIAYHALSVEYGQKECDVAVRSSATAEDLPSASFAGQQESYLNVRSDKELLENYIKCLASLFTDRAIVYRIEQKFDHFKVALSVGVQKMIRSDLACSGVAFSLDTETGFKDVVLINSSYGLGESIVKGLVIPDEFVVHKPTLQKGYRSIIKKRLGRKQQKMVYTDDVADPVKTVQVPVAEENRFSLTNDEILELARKVVTIEDHYSSLKGSWVPMDVEWAKDGLDNRLYIIQARPETIHGGAHQSNQVTTYHLQPKEGEKLSSLVQGQSIGQKIISGPARVIAQIKDIDQIKTGDILVTVMTDPDWVPAMKKAAGIITDRGGRTCHAAIVSRELKIPALVGTENATNVIKTGDVITLDCSQGEVGFVYPGIILFTVTTTALDTLPHLPVALMVNIADPDGAFSLAPLPIAGVGLARVEFIITNAIKVHPMALIHPEKISDKTIAQKIDEATVAYSDKKKFFIEKLAEGIGMIAAALYPRPVITRFSDFKSNEYRELLGGIYFEEQEENPMLGFRGASRYYNGRYQEAFALECAAITMVREQMGFSNVKVMLPFVRTVEEAKKVLATMGLSDIRRGENDLEVIMMCEIPSNVVLIDEFSQLFDGFSIGSNDLTQLVLGVDRDSAMLMKMFDERDPAVKKMFTLAIEGAHRNKHTIGICGQAPSDYPEIADFLIECGIDSLSLNADSVLPFIMRYAKK